jgi:hypothetical protein
MTRLTDTEKQDIIRFLEADKPLPDKYRFLLFADKREVELVWNGKKRVKVAVKVVDIFGNDTMTIVDVAVGKTRRAGSVSARTAWRACKIVVEMRRPTDEYQKDKATWQT